MKKIIAGLLSLLVIFSVASPLLARADVVSNTNLASSTVSSNLGEPETIYENPQTGEIYTSSEVIKPGIKSKIETRSLSASPISIGILWKYNTKASGTTLRNTFRKAATAEGAVGLVAIVAAAGLETGPLDLAIAAFVGAGTIAFHNRFSEGASLINTHPNSGRIYMYLDHTTYSKY